MDKIESLVDKDASIVFSSEIDDSVSADVVEHEIC